MITQETRVSVKPNIPKGLLDFIKFGPFKISLKEAYYVRISKMNWPVEVDHETDATVIVVSSEFSEYTNYDRGLNDRAKEIKRMFDENGYEYYWQVNWSDMYFITKGSMNNF